MRTPLLLAVLSLAPLLAGCVENPAATTATASASTNAAAAAPTGETVMGDAANLQLFASHSDQAAPRQPATAFPVTLAVVRVQAPGFRNGAGEAVNRRGYAIVLPSDDATQNNIDPQLSSLPQVRRVVQLNPLVLADQAHDDRDHPPLLAAAARVHADVLVVYTLSTRITTDKPGNALDKVTLGFLKDRTPTISTSASALILDVKTGYLFGLAQANDQQQRHTNFWGIDAALADIGNASEQAATDKLMLDVRRTWDSIVDDYGPTGGKRRAKPRAPSGVQLPSPGNTD